MCNIGKKALKMIPLQLRSVCWGFVFFFVFPPIYLFFFIFIFVFLHVPPPHYWCWLAVSGSNNMAEWFSKNTVVAVRLFKGSHSGGGWQSAAPSLLDFTICSRSDRPVDRHFLWRWRLLSVRVTEETIRYTLNIYCRDQQLGSFKNTLIYKTLIGCIWWLMS